MSWDVNVRDMRSNVDGWDVWADVNRWIMGTDMNGRGVWTNMNTGGEWMPTVIWCVTFLNVVGLFSQFVSVFSRRF